MVLEQRPHAVVPVYRGDRFWTLMLDSLRDSRELFDQVVFSFDGPDRDELAKWLRSSGYRDLPSAVLTTPRTMSWAEHIKWLVAQEPMLQWGGESIMTVLAEDDLICRNALERGLVEVSAHESAVLFGTWGIHGLERKGVPDESTADSVRVRITDGPEVISRLTAIASSGATTSVAGVTLRVHDFRTFVMMHGPSRSEHLFHGVRAEYLMAAQPAVQRLIELTPPPIEVQRHANQGNKTVPSIHWVSDEGMYQLWLLVAPRPVGLKNRVIAGMRLVRRIAQRPLLVLKIKPALEVFRTLGAA